MALTPQDVAKIAKLARIALNDAEKEHYTHEINHIITWVEQLQQVDTEGVEQLTSVADLTLPFREDKVTDGNYPQAVLKNAPMADYDCFVVPKVIE
jgi:aspartyl-tRNA(Asn)/glutamyl-tRNA(Gln) amidotransferase subunit C